MATNQEDIKKGIEKYGSLEALLEAVRQKYGEGSSQYRIVLNEVNKGDRAIESFMKDGKSTIRKVGTSIGEGMKGAVWNGQNWELPDGSISNGTGGTSGSGDSTSDFMGNFDMSANELLKAKEAGYNITTQRDLEKFRREQEDLTNKYNKYTTEADIAQRERDLKRQRAQEDYNRYISQTQQDFNRDMANTTRDFATKLSQASNAYGQRGLLRSGVQGTRTGEAIGVYNEDQVYMKTLQQRRESEALLALNRGKEEAITAQEKADIDKKYNADLYALQQSRAGVDIANYRSDRTVGWETEKANTQATLDTLFNTTYSAYQENLRKKAQQDAIDKTYGTTSTPYRVPYRSGGKYIF